MDKKTIIALVLIFGVFWLSNKFLWKPQVPVELNEGNVSEEITKRITTEENITAQSKETELVFHNASDVALAEDIVLFNEKMSVTFSNLGGVIRNVALNEYLHYDQDSPVDLIPETGRLMGLSIAGIEQEISFDNELFKWTRSEHSGIPFVEFYLEGEEGTVRKRYSLIEDYHLHFELIADGLGDIYDYQITFGSGIAETEKSLRHKGDDFKFIGQFQTEKKVTTLKRIKDGELVKGVLNWGSIKSKYFMMAIIPEQRLESEEVRIYENNESPAFDVKIRPGRPVRELSDNFELYLGPIDYKNLESFGVGMEENVELGWKFIRPMGRLFLWILKQINSMFPNYGITIIIFAFFLKLVLYPLTHKSFESTHKMQKVQPLMREIQTKYKSDPKQMQVELQKMYKEHGVNPVGGCLPLLFQMPVFFALYPVLRYSIELRQASFVWWIQDLSEPDAFLILPILMGIFMFVQQKMSMPKKVDMEKMDEKQAAAMQSQKMMLYIMPVFMVFIFRTLPSGLVLYWTVFNVFSIAQQYYIKRRFVTK